MQITHNPIPADILDRLEAQHPDMGEMIARYRGAVTDHVRVLTAKQIADAFCGRGVEGFTATEVFNLSACAMGGQGTGYGTMGSRGGARPGSGRKPTRPEGSERWEVWVTPEERAALQAHLARLRSE